MNHILCGIFVLIGSSFTFIAALGVFRFPDLLLRMHAATKAGTLGVSMILIAVMIYFGSPTVIIKSVLTILFIFITAPVGSHVLARAAYFINIPLCKETMIDELREYHKKRDSSDEKPSHFVD